MARFTLVCSALLLAVAFLLIILMSRSETNWNKTHNCEGHSTNHWKKALRKLKDLCKYMYVLVRMVFVRLQFMLRMCAIFQDADTEGCLVVNASNAFNFLNHRAALHNVSVVCPPLSLVMINAYRSPVRMIVRGSGEILMEGTTQGNPLAMAMYALAMVPLIHCLKSNSPDVKQAWYVDDAKGAGSCEKLRH